MTLARPVLFLALLAAGSCDGDGIRPVEGLRLAPSRLTFPDTYVGGSARLVLRITNVAPAPAFIELMVDAPFSIAERRVSVGPNSTVEVGILFEPQRDGVFESTLTSSSGSHSSSVLVTGRGLAPPACPDTGCATRAFDPVLGHCVALAVEADGTACEEACVGGGRCHSGLCEGAARDCDDGNVCTTDSCEAEIGCVHRDASEARCPSPEDLCRVPLCDPATGGCGEAVAPEGTPCGVSDCDVSPVCRSGECVFEPTPDGAACPATPCQDEGVCQAGVCARAPPRVLQPEWTYAREGWRVQFPGVTNASGDLFWSECEWGTANAPCELVSFTAEGKERWRQPLPGTTSSPAVSMRGHIVLYQDLVLHGETDNFLEARRQSDGSVAWSLDLLHHVTGGRWAWYMVGRDKRGVKAAQLVDNGHGRLFVQVTGHRAPQPARLADGAWLLAISPESGGIYWTAQVAPNEADDFAHRMIGDEQGNLYYATYYRDASKPGALVSLDPFGTERWRLDGGVTLMAAWGKRLLGWTWDQRRNARNFLHRSTETGGELSPISLRNQNDTPPQDVDMVATRNLVISSGIPCDPPWECEEGYEGGVLNATDLATGLNLWRYDYDPQRLGFGTSQPLLTSRSTVLFAGVAGRGDGGGGRLMTPTLREITLDGRELYACELEPTVWGAGYVDSSTLTRGHLMFGGFFGGQISAYPLQGMTRFGRGWSGGGGTSTGSMRGR